MGNYRIRHPKPNFRKFKAMLLVASPQHKMWRKRNYMIEIEIPHGDFHPVKYAMKKLFDYDFKISNITRDAKRLGCSMRKLDMNKREFYKLPPLPNSPWQRWSSRRQRIVDASRIFSDMHTFNEKASLGLMYSTGSAFTKSLTPQMFDAKPIPRPENPVDATWPKITGEAIDQRVLDDAVKRWEILQQAIIDNLLIKSHVAVRRPDGGTDVYHLPSGAPYLAQEEDLGAVWYKDTKDD